MVDEKTEALIRQRMEKIRSIAETERKLAELDALSDEDGGL